MSEEESPDTEKSRLTLPDPETWDKLVALYRAIEEHLPPRVPPKAYLEEAAKGEARPEKPLVGYSPFSDIAYVTVQNPVLTHLTEEGVDIRIPPPDITLNFDSSQPGRLLAVGIGSPGWGRNEEFVEYAKSVVGSGVWDKITKMAKGEQTHYEYVEVEVDELVRMQEKWRQIHLQQE